jgi:hypothetical protein
MIPTVGFNMRKVTKGNVSIKARRLAPPRCVAARGMLTRAHISAHARSYGTWAGKHGSAACGSGTAGA